MNYNTHTHTHRGARVLAPRKLAFGVEGDWCVRKQKVIVNMLLLMVRIQLKLAGLCESCARPGFHACAGHAHNTQTHHPNRRIWNASTMESITMASRCTKSASCIRCESHMEINYKHAAPQCSAKKGVRKWQTRTTTKNACTKLWVGKQ